MHHVRSARACEAVADGGEKQMPKTVMIVEDNELNMKLFHDLLEAKVA